MIPAPEHLPRALTGRAHWVAWRYVPDPRRPDKPKKMPYNPRTGERARTNDPSTWYTYAVAAQIARTQRYDGVGFCFRAEDGLVGIDFDGCRDSDTGEIAEWARPWLDALGGVAYLEVSPSGTGIKAIVQGRVARALKKSFGDHQGIEIYTWGRYFTITGERLPESANEPGDAQDVLDRLYVVYARPEEPAPAPATPARVAPDAPAPVGEDWQAVRRWAVERMTEQWVRRKLDQAVKAMGQANAGERHNLRLGLGRLMGGVVAAVPGVLTEAEVIDALFHAALPDSHHAQERKAIADGVRLGLDRPLAPDLTEPTDLPPLAVDGRALCPRCDRRIWRSKHPYARLEQLEPGWYCSHCRWPMVWPRQAWRGGADGDGGPTPPFDGVEPPGTATVIDAATPDQEGVPVNGGRWRLYRGTEIDQIPPPRHLVRGLLARRAVSLFVGPAESGKTTIMAHLSCRVAEHYNVLYIAAEDAPGVRAKIRGWELQHGKERPEGLTLIDQPVYLLDGASIEELTGLARRLDVQLIVVDTLSRCIPGVDENSPEISQVTANLNKIAETLGIHIAVLHHSLKHDATVFRGHSSLRDNTYTLVNIVKEPGEDVALFRVDRHKGARMADVRFHLAVRETDIPDPDEPGGMVTASVALPARAVRRQDDELNKRELAILAYLRDIQGDGGATSTEIGKEVARQLKCSESGLRKDVARLGNLGYLTGSGKQPRSITQQGLNLLRATEAGQTPAAKDDPLTDPFVVNLGLRAGSDHDQIGSDHDQIRPVLPPSRYTALPGYDDDDAPPPPPAELSLLDALRAGLAAPAYAHEEELYADPNNR